MSIVGRTRELRVVLAALAADKPILLFGLPGVSKTTIIREMAAVVGRDGAAQLFTVTGDEQLTAFSLVGTFDPALVLRDGFKPEYFTPGPLVRAMEAGGILYVEELNRASSGVLNALLTCLSDGYLDVPRYGRVNSQPGFVVVGACNPLDDVGTGRLARGLADRFVTLELDYQPRHEELEIVRMRAGGGTTEGLIPFAVDVARGSRQHPELRYGASVRGAIDFIQLIAQLGPETLDEELFHLLGCSAYSGKVRVKPTVARSACEIVSELMRSLLEREYGGDLERLRRSVSPWGEPQDTGAEDAAGEMDGSEPQGGRRTANAPSAPDRVPGLVKAGGGEEAGRSRAIPAVEREHSYAPPPSAAVVAARVDERADPLAEVDQVRRWAAQLVLRKTGELREGANQHAQQALVSEPWWRAMGGELDLDASLDGYVRTGGHISRDDVRILGRAPETRDYVILVDHSGSMVGKKLLLSAVMAAVLAQLTAQRRGDYAVLAFDDKLKQVKGFEEPRDVESVVETILRLPEGRATDLSRAFLGTEELISERAHETDCILISDCMPTRGDTTYAGLQRLAQRIGSLYVAYVEERGAAIELFGPGGARQRFDLYEWWARRWVGDERVQLVREIDDVGALVQRLSGLAPGDRL
jgi:MoxR-like ATPase/Mg-chelatase subunit ChlD